MQIYLPSSLCSFLTGLGCPNCIECFTSQGLQNIYHLQSLTIEVTAYPAPLPEGHAPMNPAPPPAQKALQGHSPARSELQWRAVQQGA